MEERRPRGRGPHPQDARLFARKHWPDLREAVADLSWLRSRGYAETSSIKIVGDRYRLTARQRSAVVRSACGEEALVDRRKREVPQETVAGQVLLVDGFNLITTLEAALAGGILLRGRDGCVRYLSSMHGNYRLLADTETALRHLLAIVEELEPRSTIWYLDEPVSNSGRLRATIKEMAASFPGTHSEVRLVRDPDPVLKRRSGRGFVVTADSGILDACGPWLNLAALAVSRLEPPPEVIDLSGTGE